MKNRHEGLAEMKKDGVTYCNMFWLFMFGNVLGTIPGGFRMKDGSYEDICPYYIEV